MGEVRNSHLHAASWIIYHTQFIIAWNGFLKKPFIFKAFNPSSPNINMHILLTVLGILLMVLVGEFAQISRHCMFGDHFLYSGDLLFDQVWIL